MKFSAPAALQVGFSLDGAESDGRSFWSLEAQSWEEGEEGGLVWVDPQGSQVRQGCCWICWLNCRLRGSRSRSLVPALSL